LRGNEILVRKVYDLTRIEEAHIFKNTGIGIVAERGMETRDVAIEDKVVWIGIPANDSVTVPEYLFERIPEGLEDNIAIFAGIGAFIIQAVRESGLNFGERTTVVGQGIIKDITCQVTDLFGIHNLEFALACKGNMEIDGIFICREGDKDINLIANSLRNKATVTVLAEGHIDLPPKLFQQKELKLIYPALPKLDERNVYYPRAYMRWTIKEDLQLVLKLLKEAKIKTEDWNGKN
jgi:hypothetical protein